MKKIYAIALAAALLLVGTQAKAQLSAGIGYLFSQEITRTTNSNDKPSSNFLHGFYAGANYNLHMVAGLGVAPGFYVNMLFGMDDTNIGNANLGANVNAQFSELALNIPVMLNYQFPFGRENAFFIFGGPVFQLGVMSKTLYTGTFSANFFNLIKVNETQRYTYNHYKGDDTFKPDANPFNLYLGGGIGVQLGDMQIIVGYDYSMLNCSKLENTKTARSQIKAGVALSF